MRIAIDLGTTNSLVAVRRNGKTELVPNQFGKFGTPSIVYVNKHEIHVGDMAFEKEIHDPKNTFRLFKRSMGDATLFGPNKLSAIDLSSLVIQQLIKDAEAYTNETVTEVIVSVPAYFTDAQRQATRQSALRCGIEAKRIINEPSAAALAYYTETNKEGMVLVFDFGGGTLDVTVVDLFENIVDIVSISGDNALGGHDLDTVLFKACIQKNPNLNKLSLEETKILQKKMEQMKIDLSINEYQKMNFILGNHHVTFELTQQEYIHLCEPILKRIKKVVARALTDAGLKVSDIDDVICVGGSSKSIVIQEYLKELMGRTIVTDINPDEAIVLGLGKMLAIMDRESKYQDIVLTDVCPFTLGVGIIGDVYSPIIPRNTTLPTSQTKYYVTTQNNQRYLSFDIYQGESLVASSNKHLLTAKVNMLKKPKGMAGTNVTFAYDINGILNVNVEGGDATTTFSGEVFTNSMITESELKKTRILLEKLQEREPITRDDLLVARFERLFIELSGKNRMKVEMLFKDFQSKRDMLPKGEHVVLVGHLNEILDELEKQITDPFDSVTNQSGKHMN